MPRAFAQPVLCALLLGAGWGGVQWLRSNQPPAPQAPVRVLKAVEVLTQRLVKQSPELLLSGFGTLEAARTAVLASEVSGTLIEVSPDWRAGALVQRGSLLWAVDARASELEVRRQEALIAGAQSAAAAASDRGLAAARKVDLAHQQLLVLRREEARWRQLEESGQGLESRLDRALGERLSGELALSSAGAAAIAAGHDLRAATAQEAHAQSALESAQLRVEKARVLAPFSGHLDVTAPALGTLLVPGQALVRLQRLDPMRLVLSMDERDVLGLRLGQIAQVRLNAVPGQVFEAQVAAIGMAADARTRTVRVELDLAPRADALRMLPGMFGSAEINAGQLEDVLVIPESAVVRRRGAPMAFVLLEGQARRRELLLGRRLGAGHVVRSGLESGELLILGPLPNLSHGSSVVAVSGPGSR